MGCAPSRKIAPHEPAALRLVLFSQHAAEVPKFEEALKSCGTTLVKYDFETTTSDHFVALLKQLVKKHGHFERVALAPHGPKRPPPPSVANEDSYAPGQCHWELSGSVIMTDPCQLSTKGNPARNVLVALGRATIPGGSVDLLSCSLLSTWACPPTKWPKLLGFISIEEEAECHFAACTHACEGNPLQSEDEWLMETDESRNIKAGYFLPPENQPSSISGILSTQLGYAKANASLIRVSDVFQNYAMGGVLGRGSFAMVRQATRRAEQHVYIPSQVAIKVIDKARYGHSALAA